MHLLLVTALLAQSLAAFPGAQGGGTTTPGGRGGTIMEITNLNPSGTGSYSACVAATFPRTCICRVAGVIPIPKDVVTGGPFLTIDGQTCPGGGIILGDGKTTAGRALVITTHDIVARYLTVNPNNPNTPTGPDTGTTGIEIEAPGSGVLDHVSCFFGGNKCIIAYTSDGVPIQNFTQQWSFFSLPNVGHPVGPMTDTNSSAYLNINQDFHHNFYAWIGHRIALYNTTQGRWVNNLTWNWCDPNAAYGFAMEPQGPSQLDLIGNIWKKGNMNAGCSNPHPVNINATGSSDCTTSCWNGDGLTHPFHYMSGNVCDQGADWTCAAQVTSEGGAETGPVPASWQRPTPLAPEPNPIVADPVTGLEAKILATVGNSQSVDCSGNFYLRRNSVDQMVIGSYPNGNGFLFSQNVAMPTIPAATACPEDPVTHVPTAYLAARGIPTGTNPWTIWPGDTYSILETYVNGASAVPPVTVWTGWLGADALPGAAIGAQVVINANAGPVRAAACTATGGVPGAPISPQPTGIVGQTVTVLAGPSPVCSAGVAFWQVTSNATPPPPHPTVSCSPTSVQTGSTSNCTANQQVTWSASAGTITAAGLFTAPATAQTVQITGTNANGSGTTPVTVTAAPPPTTYPTITLQIAIPGGATTTLTCTSTNGAAYVCK